MNNSPLLAGRFLILVLLLGLGRLQAAEKRPGFDSFRLVRNKNIFDPGRRPMKTEPSANLDSKANRSSSLSLTGTMVTDGKTLAFFTGTRTEYKKVVLVGGSIADFKVVAIKPTHVQLERAGQPRALNVGEQLVLDVPSDLPVEATPAPGPSTAREGAPTEPVSPTTPVNDPNEVLRRMKERREKEMSK